MEFINYPEGVVTVGGIPILEDIGHAFGEIVRGTADLAVSLKNRVSPGAPPTYLPTPGSGAPEDSGDGMNPWLLGGLALGAGVIAFIVLQD